MFSHTTIPWGHRAFMCWGEFIQLCQKILSKKIETLNPKKVKRIQDSKGNSCCNLWIQIEVIVKCTGKAT